MVRSRLISSLLLTAVLVGASCSQVPLPPPPVPEAERLKLDSKLGEQLSRLLEPRLKVRKATDVTVFLRALAERLVEGAVELKQLPLGVFVFDEGHGPWRTYGLPAIKIYLPQGLLKHLSSDAEVAAVLAVELGHVLNRHVSTRTTAELSGTPVRPANPADPLPEDVPLEGPRSVFNYTDAQNLEVCATAVDLLHRAGIDPRALTRVWEIHAEFEARSPLDQQVIFKMREQTRQAIALYTPLRNPIIRTEAFLKIQKRIQSL